MQLQNRLKNLLLSSAVVLSPLFVVNSLHAHFQVIKPAYDHINKENSKNVTIDYMFMHPFEQTYMEMEKPIKASLFLNGKEEDVSKKLTSHKNGDSTTWSLNYDFKRPGDYILYVEPKPYFEPAEGKFIKHLTKTVVSAFGKEEGWDNLVGAKAEILPLVRPYGLWKNNIFSGQVLFKGKAVPNAEIEVEFYNEGKKIVAPYDSLITQVIKADANGIFHYAMPHSGYWGFAALLEDDEQLKYSDGKMYPVELGAVFWVKTY